MEKENLKAVFFADLNAWISNYREGQAVMSENGRYIEVSCINKVIHGANCYEESKQETTTLPYISNYDLENYLNSFVISFDNLTKYGFSEKDYINFLDNWNNITRFVGYEENERVDEDYYFNYNNKISFKIQVDDLCDYLISNPFSKPMQEIKECFENIKFDEVIAEYRADKLESELNEKPLERKKPKI